MNEKTGSSLPEGAEAVHSLATAIGAHDAGFCALLLEALNRVDVFLSIKDLGQGRYVHVNARMAELFGRSPEQMVGAVDADLIEPAQAMSMRLAEQAAVSRPELPAGEHRLERNGQKREFKVTRIPVPRADGAVPSHIVSIWVELTAAHQRELQLQQALAQLEQSQVAAESQRRETQDQALRDNVTGLYQRMHFDDQLRREVDLSSREHREFALVSIALDPLSTAAAALGPSARTRILESLGQLLRGNTRAMDASCRLDEHRFALLLSGVGLATAHSRMEGLRRQCATQIVVLDGRDLGFTVSMGVASFPHTAHTEEDLLNAANTALAEASRRGGNHVTLASIRFELG